MKQRIILGSNIGKSIRKLILLLFGLLFWVGAIINQKYLVDYNGAVSVRYRDPVLTEQEIKNRLEGMNLQKDSNIPKVTLWQKEEDTLITNDRMNTSLRLALITVVGDMRQVYPGSILQGGALFEEDYEGCVIDRDTAYKLFQSEEVVGMKLSIMKKEYVIRGVMKTSSGNTMIIQANDSGLEDGAITKYSCMELRFSDSQNAITLAKKFVSTCDVGEPSAYIDGYLYQKLAERVIHIPIWFIVLWIIGLLLRKVYLLKASLILSLVGYLAVLVLSILLIKLSDLYIYYPNSLIPNRWSDFDFWAHRWKEMMASHRERAGMIQYYMEIVLKKRFFFVISGVVLAVLVEGILIKGSYHKSVE